MPDDLIETSISGYRVTTCLNAPPFIHSSYREHASFIEEFDLSDSEGRYWFLAVACSGKEWPTLVVEQRYSPFQGGFHPAILLVPQSDMLFVGAGTRLLAYHLADRPRRLWEDSTEFGFWSWNHFDGVILMSAELELAAWSAEGVKLWSMFVEPPWSYSVSQNTVHLDVMGTRSSFPLALGPTRLG